METSYKVTHVTNKVKDQGLIFLNVLADILSIENGGIIYS